MATGDLAEVSDVAAELGIDEGDLSDTQVARIAALITRASVLFNDAAERDFAPGEYTHRLRVQYRSGYESVSRAYVLLPEVPTEVSVLDGSVTFNTHVEGREVALVSWIYPRDYHFDIPWNQPYFVTVTYSHDTPVPAAVNGAVAAIVARHMSLSESTGAAIPVATSLSDALGNRVTFADWVTKSMQLLPEDLTIARRYRWPSPAIVIGTA